MSDQPLPPNARPQPIMMQNWNLSCSSIPGKVVLARDTAHVQEVVRNTSSYPSPVLAVGSMHSVTACVTNEGGTLICMSGLNKIIGLVGNGPDQLVACQAGVRLADLHDWLAKQGAEISFSPEIGDATVGSLVSTTSKDSSLAGLGYLSALVYSVVYVDGEGDIVTLGPGEKDQLASFTCSNGLMGIVVEVTLMCRPLQTIETSLRIVPVDTKLSAKLLAFRRKYENIFVIIRPGSVAYVELRKQSTKPRSRLWDWYINIIRAIKYRSFLVGAMSAALAALVPLNGFFAAVPAIHYRHEFVNRYPKVSADQSRLDFTFFEFDLAVFDAVVADMLELVNNFKAETGFVPGGLAMYFVERPGDKPSGSFSGPSGTSFMMDPFTGSPNDPRWHRFLDTANELAAKHGARMSPTQTKRLTPQHCSLNAALAHPRFTTAYYAQFLGK